MFLICFLLYFIFTFLCLFIVTKAKNKSKMSKFIAITFISLLFVVLNMYCTKSTIHMGGDRYNYYQAFLGTKTESIGLEILFNLFRNFTKNINAVFYFTTFVTCFLTLLAYNILKDANKNTLLFVMLTDLIFFSFTALKQTYTCAIAFLIYAIYLDLNSKYKHFINVFLIFIACLFHTTGFLLIPIYVLFILYENKQLKVKKYLFLIILMIVFFEPLMLLIANGTKDFLPVLSNKIYSYFGKNSMHIDDGNSIISFVKGFPYYIIAFVGIVKSDYLFNKVKNYDKYLFLSIIGAVLYFCSIFSYWLYRFTVLFYFPLGILFSISLKNIKNDKNRLLYYVLVICSEFILLVRWLYLIYSNYGGF